MRVIRKRLRLGLWGSIQIVRSVALESSFVKLWVVVDSTILKVAKELGNSWERKGEQGRGTVGGCNVGCILVNGTRYNRIQIPSVLA